MQAAGRGCDEETVSTLSAREGLGYRRVAEVDVDGEGQCDRA
jgi:hypothetical protein